MKEEPGLVPAPPGCCSSPGCLRPQQHSWEPATQGGTEPAEESGPILCVGKPWALCSTLWDVCTPLKLPRISLIPTSKPDELQRRFKPLGLNRPQA